MSKEMTVILLGLLNIIIATNLLAVPASWRMSILVLSGLGLMVVGFLLRAEALSGPRGENGQRDSRHPYVENLPAGQAGATERTSDHSQHEQEGINSLN